MVFLKSIRSNAMFVNSVFSIINEKGSMLGLAHPLEWEVAELIKKAVPSIELVRFGNSGTEVDMSAIRLARAFTGKEKIIRFEGHYHGWSSSCNRRTWA